MAPVPHSPRTAQTFNSCSQPDAGPCAFLLLPSYLAPPLSNAVRRARPVASAEPPRSKSKFGTTSSEGFKRLQKVDPTAAALTSAGFDTTEGYFGFTPFAELWTGRLACLGFAAGIGAELGGYGGILDQVGLPPSPVLAAIIWGGALGASVYGAGRTLRKADRGEMTFAEERRYASALGLDGKSNKAVDDEAARRKAANADITSMGAADEQLAEEAAAQMKAGEQPGEQPSTSAASGPVVVDENAALVNQLREAELFNCRAAMVGFLFAVGVESVNGHTTVMQMIDFAKLAGVIGENGGFNW